MATNAVKTEDAPDYVIDRATAAMERENKIIAEAIEILRQRHAKGQALTSPADTRAYLKLRFGQYEHEIFGMMLLDNRHRVIEIQELFRGTIDGTSVHPREVVKEALKANAAAMIVFHNHPSGIPEPSQADLTITRRLKEALALIDVRILDHIIVGSEASVSLAERGQI